MESRGSGTAENAAHNEVDPDMMRSSMTYNPYRQTPIKELKDPADDRQRFEPMRARAGFLVDSNSRFRHCLFHDRLRAKGWVLPDSLRAMQPE